MLAVLAFCAAVAAGCIGFGKEMPFLEHSFSCESEPSKRKVIRKLFPTVKHLFRDVVDVANGRAYDEVSEDMMPSPGCDVLLAGPSCKDLSQLNNYKKALDDPSGSSCRTMHAVVKYIQKYLPAAVIIENVRGMLTYQEALNNPPANYVLEALVPYGYIGKASRVDSFEFALPQHRDRVYLIITRRTIDVNPALVIEVARDLRCLGPPIQKYILAEQVESTRSGPTGKLGWVEVHKALMAKYSIKPQELAYD